MLEYSSKEKNRQITTAIILHQCSYTNPFYTCIAAQLMSRIQKPVIRPMQARVARHNKLFWALSLIQYLSGFSPSLFRYLFFTGSQSANELLFISRIAVGCSPRTAASGLLALMDFEARGYLSQMDVPALVLAGKCDRLVRVCAPTFIAQRILEAQIYVMKEGHKDLVENPDELNEVLGKFVLGSFRHKYLQSAVLTK